MLEGEGAERNYGPDITTYRCPNGLEWHNGQWPYLENECLNRKWSHKTLPPCKSEQNLREICGTFQTVVISREKMRAGDTGALEGDGHRLAV